MCYYTCESALKELTEGTTLPDIILLDFYLPRISGLKALSRLRNLAPKAKVILLTGFWRDKKVLQALKLGATGYVPVGSPVKEVGKVVEACLSGRKSDEPFVISRILSMNFWLQAEKKDHGLTQREKQVLRYLSRGLGREKIADNLGISRMTTLAHIKSIHEKLQARCDSETLARAFVEKLGLGRIE